MHRLLLVVFFSIVTGLSMQSCLPVPVSTVPLHSRQARPVTLESSQSENNGIFSCPAFDKTGERIAVYDSGANQVVIARSSDLTLVTKLKPTRRPRRLRFSPGGNYLVLESQPGWVEEYLEGKSQFSGTDIRLPEAIRDDIQRAEVWDLRTGQTVPNLSCDATETTDPKGGWLWARNKAIIRGYRSSAILAAQFTEDEENFSLLCWDGKQQIWNSLAWQRLGDRVPPPFWSQIARRVKANYWTGNTAVSRSEDGRMITLIIREKSFGFGTVYVWDPLLAQVRKLPGDCDARQVPVYALSRDKTKAVLICNSGLGSALRAWNLGSEQEIPLQGASFGLLKGAPVVRSEGVALSPDGQYLAAALLNLSTSAATSRSDLRLWSLEQGEELAAVPIDDLISMADYFRGVDVAFSPNSSMLVVAGKRLRLYQLAQLMP